MKRIFQPRVIEIADEIIETLVETNFFEDHEITDLTFSKNYICEKLTEKYIEDGIDLEMGIFTEAEFDEMLRIIITGSLLYSLKEKGFINSYEDENTEELFFLTDEGKKLIEELRKETDEI